MESEQFDDLVCGLVEEALKTGLSVAEAEKRLIEKAERDNGVTLPPSFIEEMGDTFHRLRQEAEEVIREEQEWSPYGFDPAFRRKGA